MAKLIQARQAQKIDTYENWLKAVNFKPMAGEILIVSDYESLVVVGDGEHFADYLVTEAVKNINADLQEAIAAHNTSTEAHADIRQAIANINIDNITSGSGEDSLVFLSDNADNASGKHSIAVGTDDNSAITGIIGDTLANKVTIVNPSAEGESSIAVAGSARAISANDVAIGPLTTAGVKGYYWSNITFNTDGTAVITLSTKQDRASAPSNIDWATGDTISIVNNTQYPACAKITGVSGANITVDKLPFSSVVSVSSKKPDDNSIFACYKKEVAKVTIPIIGTVVAENYCWYPRNGEIELGWVATALGIENLTTGSGSVVGGYNNWQAGNFGATFGRDNIGGYGNVIGGGWNESTGVHSAIFGRDHKNYGDYNFQSGRITTIESGEKNTISGEYSVIRNGKYNDVSGYNNLVENSNFDLVGGSTNKVKAGAGHIVGGKENQINSGYYNVVGGSEHNVNGDQNAAFGKKHTLTEKSDYNLVGGFTNTIEKSQSNLVGGSGNTVKNSKNIVGGSDNIVATNNNIIGGSSNNVQAGHTNIIGGANNTIVSATFSIVGGNKHNIKGDQNLVVGSENKLDGSSKSNFNIVGGQNNTVQASYTLSAGQNNKITHSYSSTIGSNLETTAWDQLVVGKYNDLTNTGRDAFVVAAGASGARKNVLTVPKSGVPSIDTDAITLGILNERLAEFNPEINPEDVKIKAMSLERIKDSWAPEKIAYGNGKFVGVRNNEHAFSTDGLNWTRVPNESSLDGCTWCGIVYDNINNKFVALNTWGDVYEIDATNSLSDGIIRYIRQEGTTWSDLIFDGTRCVAIGNKPGESDSYKWVNEFYYAYSEENNTWTTYRLSSANTNPTGDDPWLATSIAYNKGKYIVFCSRAGGGGDYGQFYYSTDLQIWHLSAWYEKYNDAPEIIIPTTNGFFACDTTGYDTWYSVDGINWNYIGLADAKGCIAAACSPDGKIVSITEDGKAFIYAENNLPDANTIINAIRIDRTLDNYGWSDITYANDTFLVTNQTHSLVSPDGINWRRLGSDGDYFFQEGADVTEDVFAILATDFMKKEDTINPNQISGDGTINSKLHIKGAGIPLTVQSTNAETVFVQFCNPERKIIGHLGVGKSGPYYRQGINDKYYEIVHSGNIEQYSDSYSGIKFYNSEYGVNLNTQDIKYTGVGDKVIFVKDTGKFIATSGYGSSIYESADGIRWEKICDNICGYTNIYTYALTYLNGTYVASFRSVNPDVGIGTYSSKDAKTWTRLFESTYKFEAIGDYCISLESMQCLDIDYHSTYSPQFVGIPASIESMAYSDGVYMAITHEGIYYSKNFQSWYPIDGADITLGKIYGLSYGEFIAVSEDLANYYWLNSTNILATLTGDWDEIQQLVGIVKYYSDENDFKTPNTHKAIALYCNPFTKATTVKFLTTGWSRYSGSDYYTPLLRWLDGPSLDIGAYLDTLKYPSSDYTGIDGIVYGNDKVLVYNKANITDDDPDVAYERSPAYVRAFEIKDSDYHNITSDTFTSTLAHNDEWIQNGIDITNDIQMFITKQLEARIAELEAKLAAMTAEPWTFTAEEGDEVTKAVYTKALLKFTVNEGGSAKEYYFEDGMTWEDWVNSEYNTSKYDIFNLGTEENPNYLIHKNDWYIGGVWAATKMIAGAYNMRSIP